MGESKNEKGKKYYVRLQPFLSDGSPSYNKTTSGPFSSSEEAERTLRGSMATGRFASGTIDSLGGEED